MTSQDKNWVQQPKGEGGGGAGDYNPTWDQSEMPVIEGILTGSRTNVGKYGKTVYDLKTEDGAVYSVWGTVVLDKQLAPIPFNSFIKIQYLGKKAGKGNSYHDYDVFVAGESAPVPTAAPATGPNDVAASDPALNQPHAPGTAPVAAPVAAEPVPVAPVATADVPVSEPQEVNENAAPETPAPAVEKESSDVPF